MVVCLDVALCDEHEVHNFKVSVQENKSRTEDDKLHLPVVNNDIESFSDCVPFAVGSMDHYYVDRDEVLYTYSHSFSILPIPAVLVQRGRGGLHSR